MYAGAWKRSGGGDDDKERCLCRAGMRDLPWQRKVNVHDTAEGKRVC